MKLKRVDHISKAQKIILLKKKRSNRSKNSTKALLVEHTIPIETTLPRRG
jgi:hypothetical protein